MKLNTLKNKKIAAGTLALLMGLAALPQLNFADSVSGQNEETMPAMLTTPATAVESTQAVAIEETIPAEVLTAATGEASTDAVKIEAAETVPATVLTPATTAGN